LRCRETPIDTQVRAWAGLSLGVIGPPALDALSALLIGEFEFSVAFVDSTASSCRRST